MKKSQDQIRHSHLLLVPLVGVDDGHAVNLLLCLALHIFINWGVKSLQRRAVRPGFRTLNK
jgi:hypothetical protein